MALLNEWLVFSLIFLAIWAVIFIAKKSTRKEMLWASIFTAPFGLTEPLFVPEYWNPPSLFNLAATTGFDIESILWCFAVGGIGAVVYETLFRVKHTKMPAHEMHHRRHRYHLLTLLSPVIVLIPLLLFTSLNAIYSSSIALFIGGVAAMLCRPDLKRKILFGGVLFFCLYFVSFAFFNVLYPYGVERFWNLEALSGVLIFGVPLEEIMFASTFGMLWSSVYEHVRGYRISISERKNV